MKNLKGSISFVLMVGMVSSLSIAVPNADQSAKQAQKGIKILKDATGGFVMSDESETGLSDADIVKDNSQGSSDSSLVSPNVFSPGSRYDTENNPILFGKWSQNLGECGPNDTSFYVRHTLGDTSYSGTQQYLTSYGDISYYNFSGNEALPYRNGNGQYNNGIDVAKGATFRIKNDASGISQSLVLSDIGPNQCPGSIYINRVADIDQYTFSHLGGINGLFYGHTWVPLTNYNP